MNSRETSADTGASVKGVKNIKEEVIDWLRDAYAMERGAEQALEKQAKNADLSTAVRQRAAAHLRETREHAEAVQTSLQALGADTSALKTGLGVITQLTKGLGTAFSSDERIKDLLDAYAMENFEIACYTALASAAERAGLAQVVETCRRIIPDEERMAQAIKNAIPGEIASYLFEPTAAAA